MGKSAAQAWSAVALVYCLFVPAEIVAFKEEDGVRAEMRHFTCKSSPSHAILGCCGRLVIPGVQSVRYHLNGRSGYFIYRGMSLIRVLARTKLVNNVLVIVYRRIGDQLHGEFDR